MRAKEVLGNRERERNGLMLEIKIADEKKIIIGELQEEN